MQLRNQQAKINNSIYCSKLIDRLQKILPPKMPFLVRQKVQISSKTVPKIEFAIRKKAF